MTPAEWDEVATLPEVRDSWSLESDHAGAALAEAAYGAKFHFFSGSPGYVGELYLIHGDTLATPPLVIARDHDGHLERVDF